MSKGKTKAKPLDMRDYISYHLDLYGLGGLVSVKGPERGGRNNDQSWFQLGIIYRPDADGHHFNDKRIDVFLGYRRLGGYWNKRHIRLAIEKEAKKIREERVAEKVWSRAQLALTDGKDKDGSFVL